MTFLRRTSWSSLAVVRVIFALCLTNKLINKYKAATLGHTTSGLSLVLFYNGNRSTKWQANCAWTHSCNTASRPTTTKTPTSHCLQIGKNTLRSQPHIHVHPLDTYGTQVPIGVFIKACIILWDWSTTRGLCSAQKTKESVPRRENNRISQTGFHQECWR